MNKSKDKLVELKLKGRSCDDCMYHLVDNGGTIIKGENFCFKSLYMYKSLPAEKICEHWLLHTKFKLKVNQHEV